MDSGRLIVHPPASGTWNMAVDEVLLDAAQRHQQCALRFYQWCEPTLSLGYFQAYSDRESHLASQSCRLVRRSTGGGAILHDNELTYSFVCPSSKHVDARTPKLYRVFHQTLIQVLATEFGVTASMFEAKKPGESRPRFLCFERRSEGDVVIGDWKVAGSAQRRSRGAILQHGSVLLGVSESAPELPGIGEITGRVLRPIDLVAPWTQAIGVELNLICRDSQLSEQELVATDETERLRFAADDWTKKR